MDYESILTKSVNAFSIKNKFFLTLEKGELNYLISKQGALNNKIDLKNIFKKDLKTILKNTKKIEEFYIYILKKINTENSLNVENFSYFFKYNSYKEYVICFEFKENLYQIFLIGRNIDTEKIISKETIDDIKNNEFSILKFSKEKDNFITLVSEAYLNIEEEKISEAENSPYLISQEEENDEEFLSICFELIYDFLEEFNISYKVF